MNGRRYLLPCLFSHRPISVVVLALGCNDLKQRHNLDPCDISAGLEILVADIERSSAGPESSRPRLVIISPPACKETAQAVKWGFRGCAPKSVATIAAFREVAMAAGAQYVDLSAVAAVGEDGIHFGAEAAGPIGEAVASAVRTALG